MMLRYAVAIFFLMISLLSAASGGERPFWRVKPKVLKKITDDRAIMVLVGAQPKKLKVSELKMQGGGQIKRPIEIVFRRVQKYDDLTKVSDYIKEVRENPSRGELFIRTEAFHYQARMTMKITPSSLDQINKKLEFKVIDGNFKGMTGAFTFEEYKPGLTLMGFEALYEYEKLPMPQFFIEFGLEIVLQKVAARMRTFIEAEPET